MTAPNIVLIVFDDMTVRQLERMPQLMRLGATGVNFLNAFASTAVCQPARATLLTGQMSHNHGLLDNSLTGYPIDHTSALPARLQAAGYRTAHVGKYFNSWVITDPIPAGWNDWHQLAPSYYGYQVNDNGVVTTVGSALADYNTTVVNNRALAAIASWTAQPSFLQIAYKAPHHDIPTVDFLNAVPAPQYSGTTPTSKKAPRNPNFDTPMGTPPAYMNHAAMGSTVTDSVDAFWRGQAEMLYSVDRSIGAIVAALAAAGKTNTIIIATSDHGYFHGEGRDPAGKEAPYLPALQVPFIVSGPSNLVAQGKTCTQLVCHLDVAATIYALTGASSTRTLDGCSLAPLLTNPSGPALRNNLLLEFLGDGTAGTGWSATVPTCRSILSPSFLYTRYGTLEEELFDLVADPFQLANLAGVSAYAGLKANLAARLAAVQACSGAACVI